MDIAKTVKKYGKIYRRILVIGNYPDPYVKQEAYEQRLTEMYASEKYKEHNIYPSRVYLCDHRNVSGTEGTRIIGQRNH